MQLSVSQISINSETKVVSLGDTQVSRYCVLFAIASLLGHLFLHSYTSHQHYEYKSDHDNNYAVITANGKIKTDASILNNDVKDLHTFDKTITAAITNQGGTIPATDDQPIEPIQLKSHSKTDIKKLGNVTIASVNDGGTLSDILLRSGIDGQAAHLIATAVNAKYHLSKIRSGDTLQILKSRHNNSTDSVKIIINNKTLIFINKEKGKNQYNVNVAAAASNNNSISAPVAKNTTANTRTSLDALVRSSSVSAIVKIKVAARNFATSVRRQNVPRSVIHDVSNILHLLRTGKQIKSSDDIEFVYENNKSTNTGKLLFISLHNKKLKIYRYQTKSGSTHYVKQSGIILRDVISLIDRRDGLKMSYPVHNPVFGSGFGMRKHPILKRVRMHSGIDYRAKRGTPIYAPADGMITQAVSGRSGFGNHIKIRHNNTYTTLYAHLDKFAGKAVGSKIKQGEIIGYVGSSGLATGAHLHFEVHRNGRPINPSIMLANAVMKPDDGELKLNGKQMNMFKRYQIEVDRKIGSNQNILTASN